jgi:pimeloyl-ACP methyl ester carboxylesterase
MDRTGMVSASGIAYVAGQRDLNPALPTLVFIHGAAGSRLLWEEQARSLSGCANTLALDLPGHGESPGPGLRSIQAYAEAVKNFILSIQAPGPVPCGHSMGGAITLQMLLDSPKLYTAGILVNSGARLRVSSSIFQVVEQNFEFFSDMLGLMVNAKKDTPEALKHLLSQAMLCSQEVVLHDFRACDAFDVTPRLPEIQSPVLVLASEEDRLTPPKFAEYLQTGISGCRKVVIPEAGHFLPVEQSDRVAEEIREFVAGLDSPVDEDHLERRILT